MLAEFGIGSESPLPSTSAQSGSVSSREQQYLFARRPLHVWPLEAPSVQSLHEFARKYLQMADDEFMAFGIATITACKSHPQNKISDEYSVEFRNIADRGCFKSYAPRLQPHKRAAGIRLSLPFPFFNFQDP